MSKRNGVALATIVALAVAAGAGAARGPQLTLSWQAPTPRDGTAFTVSADSPFTLNLAAASTQPQLVLAAARLSVNGESAETVKRSEEHTSELQSHHDLVCRLLLEKKNKPAHAHT